MSFMPLETSTVDSVAARNDADSHVEVSLPAILSPLSSAEMKLITFDGSQEAKAEFCEDQVQTMSDDGTLEEDESTKDTQDEGSDGDDDSDTDYVPSDQDDVSDCDYDEGEIETELRDMK